MPYDRRLSRDLNRLSHEGKPIRAALLDFDGTIVRHDLTTMLASVNGKQAESDRLNRLYQAGMLSGVSALIERINLLDGISLDEMDEIVDDDHLMPGAEELFEYFRGNRIITIVASGSIVPILQHYQRLLGFDHIVGTSALMVDDVIRGVKPDDLPVDGFKLAGCVRLLEDMGIEPNETLAIGDSPADEALLKYAGHSIAINPVGGLERFADYVISDLHQALAVIRARGKS